jgi:hypothetical protein
MWVGAGIGAFVSMADERVQGLNDRRAFALGATLGGAFGGRLPDIFEPATSPRHRQFCHAVIPAGTVALIAREGIAAAVQSLLTWAEQVPIVDPQNPQAIQWERYARFFVAGFVKGVPAGYVSHFVLDGCTPCGLPWIGELALN